MLDSILPCNAKRQYLLTLQVSRYCLLAALLESIACAKCLICQYNLTTAMWLQPYHSVRKSIYFHYQTYIPVFQLILFYLHVDYWESSQIHLFYSRIYLFVCLFFLHDVLVNCLQFSPFCQENFRGSHIFPSHIFLANLVNNYRLMTHHQFRRYRNRNKCPTTDVGFFNFAHLMTEQLIGFSSKPVLANAYLVF